MIINEIKKANLMAMKNKDQVARTIYSVLLNKYNLIEIAKRTKKEEMQDSDMVRIIQKTVKELTEEASNYVKAGNEIEAKKIEMQKSLMEKYLPKMLTEAEIKEVINSLDDKSVPNVMRHFKQNYTGKCDMGLVNKTLRSI
jgi:uncharacterized protein YqeY